MTSCTYDMPRSACSVALETYHGASTIILRILHWLLWSYFLKTAAPFFFFFFSSEGSYLRLRKIILHGHYIILSDNTCSPFFMKAKFETPRGGNRLCSPWVVVAWVYYMNCYHNCDIKFLRTERKIHFSSKVLIFSMRLVQEPKHLKQLITLYRVF
jgi:hypothetical protein